MIIYQQTKPFEYGGFDPKINLTYPNGKLRQIFMDYKEDAMTFLPKSTAKRVEEMEALYWKIKNAENDQELWMECLKEAKNFQFVKRNVEHRLSFNLCNKKLWKLYINYLKTVEPQEMLQAYSKYCRFFLDDDEMLDEYKHAVAEHGPVLVKWKNRYNFETKDPIEEYPVNIDRGDEDPFPEYSAYIIEFGTFISQPQSWSMPSPLIRYIRCNANSYILKKLHQSCKYFFAIQPQIICYQFTFDNISPDCSSTSLAVKDSIFISANSFLPVYRKNLHIATTLKVIHRNPMMLSNLIRKCIYKCKAEFITIYEQKLTENELKFLIGHGNVEKLKLHNTLIKNEDDEEMPLLEMLKLLPKIRYFDVNCLFKSKTAPILSELEFQNKFIKFVTVSLNYIFDPVDFHQFLKTNAAPFSCFRFEFGHECSAERVKELKQNAKRAFENQKRLMENL
uniref:Uncharacterized protein n=1 Tax=Panagrolaimus sp. PS1159 TaxID=55785 RepID=A0AC35G5T8_9BILA